MVSHSTGQIAEGISTKVFTMRSWELRQQTEEKREFVKRSGGQALFRQ
jgi:hypothetical protein